MPMWSKFHRRRPVELPNAAPALRAASPAICRRGGSWCANVAGGRQALGHGSESAWPGSRLTGGRPRCCVRACRRPIAEAYGQGANCVGTPSMPKVDPCRTAPGSWAQGLPLTRRFRRMCLCSEHTSLVSRRLEEGEKSGAMQMQPTHMQQGYPQLQPKNPRSCGTEGLSWAHLQQLICQCSIGNSRCAAPWIIWDKRWPEPSARASTPCGLDRKVYDGSTRTAKALGRNAPDGPHDAPR